jgi:hypothetical protein
VQARFGVDGTPPARNSNVVDAPQASAPLEDTFFTFFTETDQPLVRD